MTRYAAGTSVTSERTQTEIRRVLFKYGATGFGTLERGNRAGIIFEVSGLTVQIELPLPDRESDEFVLTPTGRSRSDDLAFKAWEQATRQRWRALLLAIRAKLEAVESQISTIEQEFLPFVRIPGGQTVGQHLLPQLEQMVLTGKAPKLLPMLNTG